MRAPTADPNVTPMLSTAVSGSSRLPVQKLPKEAISAIGTWMAWLSPTAVRTGADTDGGADAGEQQRRQANIATVGLARRLAQYPPACERDGGADEQQQNVTARMSDEQGAEKPTRRSARRQPRCRTPCDRAMPGVEPHPDRAAEDEAEHAGADRRVHVDPGEAQAGHQEHAANTDAADQDSGDEGKRRDCPYHRCISRDSAGCRFDSHKPQFRVDL